VLAADVLYHEEHFPELINTFLNTTDERSLIVLCYEQRRKNLRVFLHMLSQAGTLQAFAKPECMCAVIAT
jgi:tRNA 2-selenouridine synthase SelU